MKMVGKKSGRALVVRAMARIVGVRAVGNMAFTSGGGVLTKLSGRVCGADQHFQRAVE